MRFDSMKWTEDLLEIIYIKERTESVEKLNSILIQRVRVNYGQIGVQVALYTCKYFNNILKHALKFSHKIQRKKHRERERKERNEFV